MRARRKSIRPALLSFPILSTSTRLRQTAATTPRPIPDPYALYLGKLAPNKGTASLIHVTQRAQLPWPLIVAGDGPDRSALEGEAARHGRDVRFVGWVNHEDAIRWLAHAAVLVFPSRGPESLSRVLIEASALGVPIAAMNTGGTTDIVTDEVTGLLSSTPDELAADLRRIVDDPALGARLGAAARRQAEERFDAGAVVSRIERLYVALTQPAVTA